MGSKIRTLRPPDLSGAYHTKNRFYVVSYDTGEGGPREIVDKTFTNFVDATEWFDKNEKDFLDLKIHTAKLTAAVSTLIKTKKYKED